MLPRSRLESLAAHSERRLWCWGCGPVPGRAAGAARVPYNPTVRTSLRWLAQQMAKTPLAGRPADRLGLVGCSASSPINRCYQPERLGSAIGVDEFSCRLFLPAERPQIRKVDRGALHWV